MALDGCGRIFGVAFGAHPADQTRNRDHYRAHFFTGVAQGGSRGQFAGDIQPLDLGSQDFPDGSRIDESVSVTAQSGVDRAVIEAGPTADAAPRAGTASARETPSAGSASAEKAQLLDPDDEKIQSELKKNGK